MPSFHSIAFRAPSSSRLPSFLFPFYSAPRPIPFLRPRFISLKAMASVDGKDHRLARISSSIRVIPDFPKPGIMFQDITTLLLDHKAFRDTIDMFVERYREKNISVVAGIEARGFIFGPPIALAIGAKFVPLRKPKKLPGEVISEEYSLEYGTDIMEMHVGAVQPGDRALVIDDLIATGGTLSAAVRLLGSSDPYRVSATIYALVLLRIVLLPYWFLIFENELEQRWLNVLVLLSCQS